MFIYLGGILGIALGAILHWTITTSLGYEIISFELFISILVSLWAVLLPSFFSIILALFHSFFLGSTFYAENISPIHYSIGGLLGVLFLILILLILRKGISGTKLEHRIQNIRKTYYGKLIFNLSKGAVTFCILYDALILFATYTHFI